MSAANLVFSQDFSGDLEVIERALEGPSRLRFVDGRFEPHGGLEVFLNPDIQ
jgi:hypothetical protein